MEYKDTLNLPETGFDLDSETPEDTGAADVEPEAPPACGNGVVEDSEVCDGLTHGMYLTLLKSLAGTPYVDRLESSERVVAALRGLKRSENQPEAETPSATKIATGLSARLRPKASVCTTLPSMPSMMR